MSALRESFYSFISVGTPFFSPQVTSHSIPQVRPRGDVVLNPSLHETVTGRANQLRWRGELQLTRDKDSHVYKNVNLLSHIKGRAEIEGVW